MDQSPAAPSADGPEARYDDLGYRDVFWRDRKYEDLCDRVALRALLPRSGSRLIEVGAGFGRLATEYAGYGEVVLLDASEVHVRAAREALGADARIAVVLADAEHLPFPDGHFDVAVCVRVLHHFRDPRPLVSELARVVRPGGSIVLEFANRRNLKSIVRYVLRRQRWSPFGHGAVSYKAVHFDHSPATVLAAMRASGLEIEAVRAASLFRIASLTRHVPVSALVAIESRLQAPLGIVTPGPSVFVKATKPDRPAKTAQE